MVDEAVSLILDPGRRRQLGEEGIVVFWREGREPGRCEGLACILSMCPHPGCACQLVYVDGFVIDGQATAVVWDHEGVHLVGTADGNECRVTLEARMIATVDPDSGETEAHPDLPDATDPALVGWLASQTDGELLEVLHRFRARAKGYLPEGPSKDIDIDEVEKYHLAAVDDLLDGTRSDEYVLGGQRYWAAMFLCPTPWCDCHQARLVFFDDEAESGESVGSLLIDLRGAAGFKVEKMEADSTPEGVLMDLWTLFQRRHDVARFLRRREAQLKAVGETLWRRVGKPVRAAAQPGRNDPCPCGSRQKFKKCCLGRDSKAPCPSSGTR